MKSRALISIAMTLCASLVSFPLAAQQGNSLSSAPREYTLQVLQGPPDLGGLGNPNSINDQGWVTGISDSPDGTYEHAVLWRDGQPTDLGTLGGYNSAGPLNNRNDIGWVVGFSETADTDPYQENFCGFFCPAPSCRPLTQMCKGYLWQTKTNRMIALPPLVPPPLPPSVGGNNTVASGANNQQIIGIAENGVKDPDLNCAPQVFDFVGVVWSLESDGTPFVSRQLSPYGNDAVSFAGGINEVGDIVGFSGPCAPPSAGVFTANHAVLWKKDGSVINLGNLGGATGNLAAAINNQGQVVGNSDLVVDGSDLGIHAFLWEEGSGMQDLGTLPGDVQSGAVAINDSGEVVGLSVDSAGNYRSFHWQRGVMIDISALPAVSNLVGVFVNDINSRGEIPFSAYPFDPVSGTLGEQIAAVLIPAGRAPAAIPAHSTRPNADALVSALAGAKPSTSNAALPSCRPDGAACSQPGWHQGGCCVACGPHHTCCSKWLHGMACTSGAQCCSGMCMPERGCL